MRTSICFARIVLFATLGLLAAGCQQDPGALAPVTGRVSCNGAPVRGGLIVFTPDASKGEHGAIAHSAIQEDGSFNLFTGDVPGAHAGWYQVTVSCPGPATSVPGQTYNAPEATVHEKYSRPDSSKINCKVNLDQPNSFDFDLK